MTRSSPNVLSANRELICNRCRCEATAQYNRPLHSYIYTNSADNSPIAGVTREKHPLNYGRMSQCHAQTACSHNAPFLKQPTMKFTPRRRTATGNTTCSCFDPSVDLSLSGRSSCLFGLDYECAEQVTIHTYVKSEAGTVLISTARTVHDMFVRK